MFNPSPNFDASINRFIDSPSLANGKVIGDLIADKPVNGMILDKFNKLGKAKGKNSTEILNLFKTFLDFLLLEDWESV